jgi:multidrug efflux pump subunit AcrA (membrane-fusion protein)
VLNYVAHTSRRLARTLFHAMAANGPKLERKQILLGRIVDIGTELFALAASVLRAEALLRQADAELTDALYVPVQCVFHESAGNVSYVSSARVIEVRPVTVGRYNVENVQILSGLSEGETVLLSRPKGVGASEPEEAQPERPEFVETADQAQPASN